MQFATSGAEAVAAAESEPFDLIMMDVRMPGMDGLEATRLIRALPGGRGQVPVVALTAQAFADQIEQCEQAGMDSHLTKPFTPEALLRTAALALATSRPARQEVASVPPSAESVTDAAVSAIGLDLPVLDSDILGRTASYLDNATLGTYVQAVASRSRDLAQALRQPHALTADAAVTATAAHTLAGSSAMLGFTRLSELSRRLERALEHDSQHALDVAAAVIEAIKVSLEAMSSLASSSPLVAEPAG